MSWKVKVSTWKAWRGVSWSTVYRNTLRQMIKVGPAAYPLIPILFPVFFVLFAYKSFIVQRTILLLEQFTETLMKLTVASAAAAKEQAKER